MEIFRSRTRLPSAVSPLLPVGLPPVRPVPPSTPTTVFPTFKVTSVLLLLPRCAARFEALERWNKADPFIAPLQSAHPRVQLGPNFEAFFLAQQICIYPAGPARPRNWGACAPSSAPWRPPEHSRFDCDPKAFEFAGFWCFSSGSLLPESRKNTKESRQHKQNGVARTSRRVIAGLKHNQAFFLESGLANFFQKRQTPMCSRRQSTQGARKED